MKKQYSDFVIGDYVRECQECGNYQKDKEPIYGQELPTAYEFRKCKNCKSESLDYGRLVTLSSLQETE